MWCHLRVNCYLHMQTWKVWEYTATDDTVCSFLLFFFLHPWSFHTLRCLLWGTIIFSLNKLAACTAAVRWPPTIYIRVSADKILSGVCRRKMCRHLLHTLSDIQKSFFSITKWLLSRWDDWMIHWPCLANTLWRKTTKKRWWETSLH